jgi:hypothetical protein
MWQAQEASVRVMSPPPISPSCQTGYSFYICASSPTPFVGCCSVDACAASQNICPPPNIGSASFNAAAYGTFPDQVCPDPTAKFYTCTFDSGAAPFIGCCKSNPCVSDAACPITDLVGMQLSPNPAAKQAFLSDVGFVSAGPLGGTGTAGTATTTGVQTATTGKSTMVTSTGSSKSTSTSGSKPTGISSSSGLTIPFPISSKSTMMTAKTSAAAESPTSAPLLAKATVSKGAVAGITVSAFALLAGLAIILFFLCGRRRGKNGERLPSRESIGPPMTSASEGPRRTEMTESYLVLPEAYPAPPQMTRDRQRTGSVSRQAGAYPIGNAFTPRGSMGMGSAQQSSE